MSKRRRPVRTAVAALSLLAASGLSAGAVTAPAGPLAIKVGQAKDFSRVEFHWAGGPAAVRSRRDGQNVVLTFSRQANPNLADLRVHPPKWLETASTRQTGAGLELTLVLAKDADAKVGQSDGATYVNLFEKKPEPAAARSIDIAGDRGDPTPAGGIVRVEAKVQGAQTLLRFPWKAPLGAAVFRRADAVWIVFDHAARLDVSALGAVATQVGNGRIVQGDGVVALRLNAPRNAPINAWADGPIWTVAIGPGTQTKPAGITVGRDPDEVSATLAAAVAGATKIAWLTDPGAGDRIGVVTALAPSKGVALRRDFVDFAILPSAQGLALERAADDLKLASDGDIVRVSRPDGLKLSPTMTRVRLTGGAVELPKPAPMPAVIDFDGWSQVGRHGFRARYDQLIAAAAAETQKEAAGDRSVGVQARMGLARFLAGSQLSFEAIGMLDMLGKKHPELLSNSEFRGLRGAVKVLAGRYKEAETDFAAPAIAGDPSASLWQGYAAARMARWQEARDALKKGLAAQAMMSDAWRAKFARADAEAALELGDYAAARSQIALALALDQTPVEQLAVRLIQARLIEAQGAPDKALGIYDAVARAPLEQLATPAIMRATQIRLDKGQLSAAKAAETLDGLKFRWRGDAVELSVIRTLGQLYLNQGRYREALEALRSAGKRLPDLPEALQLQADLGAAFRALFLDGHADGLQPIQALAMFYDFRELTPVGADGDEMVRRLAQRLVNVDLLDQAAELLKYQAENRLDGVPRASVAADQALISLMARKPEAALEALNSSRTTLLPTALQGQRRLLEARAWIQLNNLDHAAELLDGDRSAEAQGLRAEVAWKRKSWADAARLYEVGLGRRFDIPDQPLTPEEEQRLLRAAVAYSLAEDEDALARLRGRYSGFVDRARAADALRVALAGADNTLSTGDFVKAVSDDQAFAGWVLKMKDRLRQRTAAVAMTPAKVAATPNAAPG